MIINQKIVAQRVLPENAAPESVAPAPAVVKRPESIEGKTYRISNPLADEVFFVTINFIELEGKRKPFEIFINTSSSLHYEWTTSVAMLLSFIFKSNPPNIISVLDNLGNIKTPGANGYVANNGKYISSVISDIVLRAIIPFLKDINFIETQEMDEFMKSYLNQKKEEFLSATSDKLEATGFPSSADVCPMCSTKAMIRMDGCLTCLNCGHSKCGT